MSSRVTCTHQGLKVILLRKSILFIGDFIQEEKKKTKKQNRETLKTILLSAKQCKLNLVNGYGLQEATGVKLLLPFSPPPLISPLYLNVDKE